jgi:hypothetical protein
MKTDFVHEDLARFEEAWTDLDEVVKRANKIVASFNTPLPLSDDESIKSSIATPGSPTPSSSSVNATTTTKPVKVHPRGGSLRQSVDTRRNSPHATPTTMPVKGHVISPRGGVSRKSVWEGKERRQEN